MCIKALTLFLICILFITGVSGPIEPANKLTILEMLELCTHLIIFITVNGFITFMILICLSLFIRLILNILDYDYDIVYNKQEILWIGRISTALTTYDQYITNIS